MKYANAVTIFITKSVIVYIKYYCFIFGVARFQPIYFYNMTRQKYQSFISILLNENIIYYKRILYSLRLNY